MKELLKQFTNKELLDRYVELNKGKSKKLKVLMLEIEKELLLRMDK